MAYKLTIVQALKLVVVLDELKRADFKSARSIGVDFGGFFDRASGRMTSGCSKIDCITSIVRYLIGEAMGPQPEHVAEWLDKKVPGWKEKIGYKELTLAELEANAGRGDNNE